MSGPAAAVSNLLGTPEPLKLTPSACARTISMAMAARVAMFLWGPPGIAKSAVARQIARDAGMAFIDLRLSQCAPEDLRGVPYAVREHGKTGARWMAPFVLPRDLDFDDVTELEATPTIIRFANPYNAKPEITITAIGANRRAELISTHAPKDGLRDKNGIRHADRFAMQIVDCDTGEVVAGKVHWTVTGKVHAILALEELNAANQNVQAASYELVHDRRCGEYQVPDGVFIIAMGNRENDRGVVFKMPSPLLNRFVHIEMIAHAPDWNRWAATAGIHPHIIAFLQKFPDMLIEENLAHAVEERAFRTPRTWELASKLLTANPDASSHDLLPLIAGCVGRAAGSQFIKFHEIASTLPDPEDVLCGRLSQMAEPPETQLCFAMTHTLLHKLKREAVVLQESSASWSSSDAFQEWLTRSENFIGFVSDNFRAEMTIMAVRLAIAEYELPFRHKLMPRFNAFARQNAEFLTTSVGAGRAA